MAIKRNHVIKLCNQWKLWIKLRKWRVYYDGFMTWVGGLSQFYDFDEFYRQTECTEAAEEAAKNKAEGWETEP
jgi:hypothetical protein